MLADRTLNQLSQIVRLLDNLNSNKNQCHERHYCFVYPRFLPKNLQIHKINNNFRNI